MEHISQKLLEERLAELKGQAEQNRQIGLMTDGAIQFCEHLLAELDAPKAGENGSGSSDHLRPATSNDTQASTGDIHAGARERIKDTDGAADS